jgi:hypothetical protein
MSMQSKGIKFMSPLTIGSEERAGEEWNISELKENKILQQPTDYISIKIIWEALVLGLWIISQDL